MAKLLKPVLIIVLVKNIRVPGNYSVASEGISQSLLSDWQCCKRRFLFKINRWEHPDGYRNTGYGTFIHDILDKMYTGYRDKLFTYKQLPELLIKWINGYKFPKIYSEQEQEVMRAKGQAILENYILYYKKDFTELKWQGLEIEFDLKWEGFRLRGKKDGRFQAKDKTLWHLENKNYSKINEENLAARLSFDLQNMTYFLADSVEYARIIKGVLYNILRNPEVRKKLTNAELYQYIKDNVRKDPQHYFVRFEIPYLGTDLEDFKSELRVKLSQIENECAEAKKHPEKTLSIFYKNECACESPYRCDFLNACSTGRLAGYRQKEKLFNELGPQPNQKGVKTNGNANSKIGARS